MRAYLYCTLFFVLIFTGACHKTFFGKLVDETGRPVENAILYIEAFTTHTYAFGWAKTNKDGIASTGTGSSLVLPVKAGTRYAFCILAPSRLPVVLFDYTSFFDSDTFSFVLDEKANNPLGFNSDLFKLGMPFEKNPQLQDLLEKPHYRPLVEAFISVYEKGAAMGATPDPLKEKTLKNLSNAGRQ
ncbi:MAG: hypothetical protein JXA71_02070 [Chitinispirillaceae bacterium]|nr:hypothetical protein [Chitinispirillaceae bacterium]